LIILGIASPFWHDPSAAILVDGEVVAAVEEERFTREKHAPGALPTESVRYCLDAAGVKLEDVDTVAFPWSLEALRANRFAFLRRNLTRQPRKSLNSLYFGRRKERQRTAKVERTLKALGSDVGRFDVQYVEHHLAHAASATHFSGFENCAVATIDGAGELTTLMFAEYDRGVLTKLHEIQKPDSLGLFYESMTAYLGFEPGDGEYKVMGMASYGDPHRYDFSKVLQVRDGDLWMDTDYFSARHSNRASRHRVGRKLVDWLGPPREGDEIDEPYMHVAASAQHALEQAAVALVEYHLGDVLRRTRRLCIAGGCAHNVSMNRRFLEHPLVDELFVPPGPHDAGTSLGAAAYVAASRGEKVRPLASAYLGPAFTTKQISEELDGLRIPYEIVADAPANAAALLASGEVVAWFQGRMEWGPRALGNRSILGNPGRRGTSDEINARIKYRERWRPFCPSVLAERAEAFLGSRHPAEFMTIAFRVPEEWKTKTPDAVHVDGTVRPQAVSAATNPRYHRLISEFEKLSGLPCVINTSLNRRGEPMILSPKDALSMFYGSGLEHLFLEDVYVTKRPRG